MFLKHLEVDTWFKIEVIRVLREAHELVYVKSALFILGKSY